MHAAHQNRQDDTYGKADDKTLDARRPTEGGHIRYLKLAT